jgi:putative transposase
MAYDPERHHRRSIRLAHYDYRQNGAYYVTICAHDRECLFGEITDGMMRPNAFGEIVLDCWAAIPDHFPHVDVDAFVVMPNHVHGIMVIGDYDTGVAKNSTGMKKDSRGMANDSTGMACHAPTPLAHAPAESGPQRRFAQPVAGSLATILGAFKSTASRRINTLRETPGFTVWHRNYYERIIRNEEMLDKARHYIANNPARWTEDVNHPTNGTKM